MHLKELLVNICGKKLYFQFCDRNNKNGAAIGTAFGTIDTDKNIKHQ